ncbi:SusC/RagA family TonB-linked outer membrane protein [Halosquirtibacter xylanolyticus]|uniref:SusC/RagA family TonB-linked outer membrane protein n=1 Tax=Halosquirtibacter xylanolyticus TaxID=3374599 RepID=UPI003748E88C|nr:SusC/RagA family TonB-linked outer membrane protein [Prolixibacteraceae bacterium]
MSRLYFSGRVSYALRKGLRKHLMAVSVMAVTMWSMPAMASTFDLDSDIVIQAKQTSLSHVISKIEQMTPYTFVYNKDFVDPSMSLSVDVKEDNIMKVLDKVFEGTDIEYKISGKQVALKKVTKQQKETKVKVSSTIVDEGGLPLPGVNVIVKGTSQGIITSIDGEFTLVCDPNVVLSISFMGYATQEFSLVNSLPAKIVLQEENHNIDEVVITALGIKREKKVLGYSVQEVSGEKLNETSNSNVTGALQGKVAGVQITQSSTGMGGSSKITIRGNSSLGRNNEPLWIVDGVPFNNNSDSGASLYGGYDRGGASVDINPEDIASISVLKGPNAAALYGSRAGNGVILVTTKKGVKKAGLGITYNGSFTWSEMTDQMDIQNQYGQGTNGVYDNKSRYSWGAALDGKEVEAWNGEKRAYSALSNPVQDYFTTGFSQNHNVSMGKQTEEGHYRASLGYVKNEGVFSGNKQEKMSLDINSGMKLAPWFAVNSKVSLVDSKNTNRPIFGNRSEMYQLLNIPTSVSMEDLKQFSSKDEVHRNWYGPDTQIRNPYYTRDALMNEDERLRAFGFFGLTMDFTPEIKLTLKQAFDIHKTGTDEKDRGDGIGKTDVKDIVNDSFVRRESTYREFNSQFLLTGDFESNKSQYGFTFGGNRMYYKSEGLNARTSNLFKGYWLLQGANDLLRSIAYNTLTEKEVQSLYGSAHFTYNGYATIDVTARNDWSSALPEQNNSYFYPSVNLSFVLSEFLEKQDVTIPSFIDFVKFRGSAASAGKDCDPYEIHSLVDIVEKNGKMEFQVPDTRPNDDLKPEISTSYEVGGEVKLFRNRLGLDATYYTTKTENQVMVVDDGVDYKYKTINAGSITNKGLELMLYTTPIRTKDFSMDIDVNYSHNTTNVESLCEGTPKVYLGSTDEYMVKVAAVEGHELGDIESINTFLRNEKGQVVVGENGVPIKDSKSTVIGNIQPDWIGSVRLGLRYKNLSFSGLIDMQKGGDIVSISEAIAANAGVAKITEDRSAFVYPGVKRDGTANTTEISKEQYYRTVGGEQGIAEEFVYDASFVRLKELSVTYSLGAHVLKKTPFSSVKFSFIGRNLGFLSKNTPGSPVGGFNSSIFSQAIDYSSIPNTRTLGFSVKLGF